MKVIRNKYIKLITAFILLFGIVSISKSDVTSHSNNFAVLNKLKPIQSSDKKDVLGDFIAERENSLKIFMEENSDIQELSGALTQSEIDELSDTLALLEQFESINDRKALAKKPIETIAKKLNISSNLLMGIAYKESRFTPSAVNKRSGATGLVQMTSRTWKYLINTYGDKYGLSIDTPRTDALASLLMCSEYILENKRIMTKRLKRPPTDQELYLAHALGTYGALKLIAKGEASPHMKPSDFGVEGVLSNKGLFIKNGSEQHYTAAITNILI